jgi:hypothetical protein
MIKNRTLSIIGIAGLLTLLLGVFIPAATVGAQTTTNTGAQALEIGPPVLNLSADPGQTIKATISLRDISGGSLLVTNQINDFVAGGEDGTPKILLDDNTTSPYSLKAWISPLSQLTLKSKEIKNLTITIHVPADASPGGYYGVVRFTGTPPELKSTGVSLAASLGSLILLRVNGVAKESLSVEQFFADNNGKPGTLFESSPITFVERLKNTGNLHEEPAGVVTITDMFNNKVATLGVNQPPHDILPQSIRKFESPLDSSNIGNKVLFGRYKADLSVTYGADKQVITSSITFWVIPYRLIALGIVVLIGGFIALRFTIRRYNRHIIGKAQKSRR